MGSGGTEWDADDILLKARLNQKTIHVGAAEPPIKYAGMLWYDTSIDVLKQRNAANNAWIFGIGTDLTLASDKKIIIGGDVNLYRGEANQLRTDDYFSVGDVAYNLLMDPYSSSILFGNRTNAWDVTLYRHQTDYLRTGNYLVVDKGINVDFDEAGLPIVFGADVNLYRSAANTLKTDDALDANSFLVGGTPGVSGTFTSNDGKTITVTNGIITSIV